MAVEPAPDDSREVQDAAARQRLSGSSLIAGERVSDELLARLVASGGERPFRAIYERYRQSLYGYCHSILRNEADAQDALQSTFTKALLALREGRRRAPLRPWLYRIAHNEAVSIVRDRRAAEKRLERVPRRADAPSVEERAGDRARLSSLLEDLSQLPDRARCALVMREMGGLSHEEIAAAMGLSVGAAKQAIFEARRGLLELAEGRAMSCDDITRRLSDGDRRAFRGRLVRAHLRDCRNCATFAAAIPRRQGELRALAPVLAPASATAALARILSAAAGSGSGSSGAAGSGSASAGAAGSGSAPAGAAGSSGAGGWTTAGLVAKPLVPALAPKAVLAVAVSAGVAAGGVALGVSGGHAAHRTAAMARTGGSTRSGSPEGSQASAPYARAISQSAGRRNSSQPAAGAPRGHRKNATGCGHCTSKPGSPGKASSSHSTHPAHGVGRRPALPPGDSHAAAHHSSGPPPSSPGASHVSEASSHSSASTAHSAHADAKHGNPHAGEHGNPHSSHHPAPPGRSHGRGGP